MRQVELLSANLTGATLFNAKLQKANLNGANLSEARLKGANFDEADLRDALNLTQTQLDEACGTGTKLPKGLSIQACP